MNLRLWLYGVLMSLPAAVLCAVGAYFLSVRAPVLVRAEKAAITREYRSTAEALLEYPLSAENWGPRQKGWRQTSRVRCADGSAPWGHLPVPGGELVWCGADPHCVAQTVVPQGDADLAAWLRVAVISALSAVVIVTAVGVWFFVRYSRSRDDFLAATAHDLNTPLVALRRLIGRDDESARIVCERLLRLVRNVTDFLRLGRRARPVCESFVIGDAFDEAYRVLAEDFLDERSGEVAVVGERDAQVAADRLLTVQIMWNLLGNALKYAAAAGPITAGFTVRGDMVDFSLADSGPGMSALQRRHAFDHFYRARTVLESGKGGFGIGLCTAREFARRMGGELKLAPNRPTGLIFTLSLPAKSAKQ